MKSLIAMIASLKPWQMAVCGAVLVVTFIGALVLAWGFKRWNERAS